MQKTIYTILPIKLAPRNQFHFFHLSIIIINYAPSELQTYYVYFINDILFQKNTSLSKWQQQIQYAFQTFITLHPKMYLLLAQLAAETYLQPFSMNAGLVVRVIISFCCQKKQWTGFIPIMFCNKQTSFKIHFVFHTISRQHECFWKRYNGIYQMSLMAESA